MEVDDLGEDKMSPPKLTSEKESEKKSNYEKAFLEMKKLYERSKEDNKK